jgi:hypothetical protein
MAGEEERRQEEEQQGGKALRWQIGTSALQVLEHVYSVDPFPGEDRPATSSARLARRRGNAEPGLQSKLILATHQRVVAN